MKKRLFALLIVSIIAVLALVGCENFLTNVDPNEYTVTFDVNGGSTIESVVVNRGGLVTRPATDPTRGHDEFAGWYKDAELTTPWDFEKDVVVSDTTIYAKWNDHSHSGGQATCTSGVVCDVCGETYGNALNHNYVDDEAVAPTCTTTGLTSGYHCTNCDVRVEQLVIDALGHSDKDGDYKCDVCEEPVGEKPEVTSTTIVLQPTEGTPVQGPQVLRIAEFEIILSSEKSRIESKTLTFTLPDGTFSSQSFRINFNGSETIYDAATGKWQNAIMFVTSGKGTVTIYWQHGGKGSEGDTSSKAYRNVGIWNAEGTLLNSTNEQYIYEEPIVTTFEFDAAGTYYIGNLAGANNFFYVEVNYEGEKANLPELAQYDVTFNTNGGSEIEGIKVNENGMVEKPADPTKEGFDFAGWYKDEALTTPWNFTSDKIVADTVLYAKWTEAYTGEYEDVHYELNIGDLETGTRSEDEINGKFTIVSGTEVRNRTKTYEGVEYTKSVKVGSSTSKILVDVPGNGNLKFIIQNGSSGAATQFITVTAPDGTVHNIEFAGADDGSPLVMIELEVTEGTWTISRGKNGGTQDIYFLSLDCSVPVSAETGFELVAPGKVDYLAGQELDTSKLVLNALFESGKTEPLSVADVTVDTSAFNKNVAGEYTITVSYKDYAPVTYTVTVYTPEEIELHFDAVEKLAQNSAAGNGVYFNHSWKEVYMVGDDLNTDGLSVYVIGSFNGKTLKFRVNDYQIAGFDSSASDFCRLTISAYGVEATVDIHIADTQPTANEDGVYQLLVDPAYEGIAGAMSGSYHVFSTIQGALDYAENIANSAVKELYIAPGLYKEKLEITIPNLHIIGLGETSDEVVIEWDSLYGLVDGGGFTHTTDSTATVAIRDSAVNVTIENVTISNYWNSQERMTAAGLAIERGLALLVQADRFVMKNSRLLGIQDTLELFTGRQYFENVFISGYTDFIFGTNNTTYFKNCTIHVIDTEKDDAGTAGYITAFKGSNKGAADSIVYGAIFDGCNFTADAGVMAGKTAIGRTWGAYAAVAVINSELGGHISLDGYDSSDNKNKRYISMNGIHPTDSTVQFVEYNNTGAGAITEAVAGMRFLTAEEAALYADFATIFGTTNGNVTYLDPWNPASAEVVVDDREYYYFNGTEGSSGTSYTYTDNIQGTTGTIGNITIDATAGKVTARGSDTQINAGAKLIFNVEAGTLVTVISYPGYGHYTINGVAHNANDTFSMYFAEATQVVIEATATAYIYQVIINPNEEAPEAPTLTEIKVSGLNTNLTVGDELALTDAVVKAHYSDSSVVTISDYAVDASAVNKNVAGTYPVVFSFGGQTVTVMVTYEGANADPAITENTVLDFSTPDALAAVQNNPRVTIDGSVRHNGGEIQISGTISFMVKAGTKVVVNPYANTQYASYTIGVEGATGLATLNTVYTFVAAEDCTVVYTGLDNNYLVSIEIIAEEEAPAEPTENDVIAYHFDGKSTEGAFNYVFDTKVEGAIGTLGGMTIDATTGKLAYNASGYTQFNATTKLSFAVKAGSTVVVTSYPGQYKYTVNGEAATADVTTVKFNEDTTVEVIATGGAYIYSIIITPGEPEVVDPAHECEHACEVEGCGKCTDAECGESVCADKCPGHVVAPTDEGVLNFSEMETWTGGKTLGQTEQVGPFVIYYRSGDGEKVDASGKTFDDGFVATNRLSFNGAPKTSSGRLTGGFFEFTVTGAKTLTVWWVAGGAGRELVLYNSEMVEIYRTTVNAADNKTPHISVIDIPAAGTYYLASTNNNYYFKLSLSAAQAAPAHECEHVCEVAECGKCTDEACEESVCADKCPGHAAAPAHECAICETCQKCTKEDHEGEKCEGHVEAPANVTVDVSNITIETTTNDELVAGSGIYASSGLSIDSNTKSFENLTFTRRLKLGGTMKYEGGVVKAGVKIVTNGAATIVVYAMSSSSSATRALHITTLADGAFTTLMEDANVSGTNLVKCVFTVDAAGTYYLGSKSSGINIYCIEVLYN